MPPQDTHPSAGIKWYEVTWYSKLGAIIFFVGIIPALAFYVGMQYQAVITTKSASSALSSSSGKETFVKYELGNGANGKTLSITLSTEWEKVILRRFGEPGALDDIRTYPVFVFRKDGLSFYGDHLGHGAENFYSTDASKIINGKTFLITTFKYQEDNEKHMLLTVYNGIPFQLKGDITPEAEAEFYGVLATIEEVSNAD